MKIEKDSPQVRIPPPACLLASILIGWALGMLRPLPFLPSRSAGWVLSFLLITSGLGTILYCAWKFRRVQTAIEPWKPTSKLVTTGPYRWSRNPIYTSFILTALGIGLATNNLWIALMQVPLVMVLRQFVIKREERYLEEKFGQEYLSYKARVRRWV